MATNLFTNHSARFHVGRIILLVTAGLMLLNHAILMFVLDQPLLFLGYAAFNGYALAVIAIPFRRYETWAWYVTWMLPIGLTIAAVVARDPGIMPFYMGVAVAAACGLLLTMQSFFTAV